MQIAVVLWAPGEAFEADHAFETGDADRLSEELDIAGASVDGLEVQRGEAAPHEVDEAVAAVHAEVLAAHDVLELDRLAVAQASSADAPEEGVGRLVGGAPVGDQ